MDTDCDTCEVKAEERTCDDCGKSAVIADCGHQAQPRPIAASPDGRLRCDGCAEEVRPTPR